MKLSNRKLLKRASIKKVDLAIKKAKIEVEKKNEISKLLHQHYKINQFKMEQKLRLKMSIMKSIMRIVYKDIKKERSFSNLIFELKNHGRITKAFRRIFEI